jgi:hypothetical protein
VIDSGLLEPQDSPSHPLAAWFADLRAERRAARATAQPTRTRAIITIVHNEPVFLPIWLRYYSRFFGPDDLYVLDNETTDGSTDGEGFVRIPVERHEVDHTWMVRTIEGLQHELLDRYDVVLVTDVDELISPVPEWGTLGAYLDGFDEPFVNCLGYEVLHMRDSEPPLDLSRPILDQRGWWFSNAGYDKAAIASEPMRWRPGFHGREDHALAVDPDLRLVHLHRMDFDLCRERHATRSRRPWAKLDEERRWARHNQIVEEDAFADWFYEDSGFRGYGIHPEPIRPSWRGVF